MKSVALISAVGGAGRTTFTAQLASLHAQLGRTAAALEFDPHNQLGFCLGLEQVAEQGIASDSATGRLWCDSACRNHDGVVFLPFGQPTPAERARFETLLLSEPHWLAERLAEIDLNDDAVLLIDAARFPSAYASQACAAADLILVLLPPEPQALMALAPLRQQLAPLGKPVVFVPNKLDATQALKSDIMDLLRQRLGRLLLPYRVHHDAMVSEAWAAGRPVCEYAPRSQAAHDFNGLAGWLDRWMQGENA
jgi:cellulose synthase operon protein YhjQ